MAGDLNYVYGHYNFTFVCTKLFLKIAVVSVRIFVGLNTASRRMASGSLVRQAGQSFSGQCSRAFLILWFLRLLHRNAQLLLVSAHLRWKQSFETFEVSQPLVVSGDYPFSHIVFKTLC